MARLIVEEGGAQRAFRLGDGLVTIGSGDAARLKLTSPDVADLHAELEIAGDTIRLRPRAGVVPPAVGGASVEGETLVQFGQTVQVGSALLRVEREEAVLVEEAPSAPRASAAQAAPTQKRPARASASASKRRAPAGKPKTIQKRKAVVERTPRERTEGVPTWFVVSGILVGLALVLFILWRGFASTAVVDIDPAQEVKLAQVALQAGEFAKFEAHLARVASPDDLSPADKQLYDQLFARQQEMLYENQNRERWDDGSQYKRQYLEEYEQKHFQGNVDTAKIPLFLKRCRTFRERWPDHPDLSWVQRQEQRWSEVVSLSDPPTWDSVWWEAYNLTARGSTHDYRTALKVMDEYKPKAGEESDHAEKRARLVKEREEFFWDEMQLAKHSYEKGDVTRSVQKLVGLVQKIGEPQFEEQAAKELVLVFGDPRAEGMLAGYKERYPWSYEVLVRNSTLKAYARQLGLE
jgi:hypothetical protein